MANAEAQTATQMLYESFWQHNTPKAKATADSLAQLAEGYEKAMSPATCRLYLSVLANCHPEEIVLAFTRATEECKGFFPSPATLREFSGRAVTRDPLAAEAKADLRPSHRGRPVPPEADRGDARTSRAVSEANSGCFSQREAGQPEGCERPALCGV